MSFNKSLIDESMLDLFKSEIDSNASTVSEKLLELEKDIKNPELIDSLMRSCHSIKGACRLVGIDEAVNLAHTMEDLFVAAKSDESKVTAGIIDTMLTANDILHSLSETTIDTIETWADDKQDNILATISAIESPSSAEALQPAPAPEQPEPVTSADEPAEQEPEAHAPPATAPDAALKPEAKEKPPASEDTSAATDKSFVRINTGRLNNIISLAGELDVTSKWIESHNNELLALKKLQNSIAEKLDKAMRMSSDGNFSRDIHNTLLNQASAILGKAQEKLTDSMLEFEDYDRRTLGITSKLNHELVTSRMRPFGDITHAFDRMTRDISRQLGKSIELEITGKDTLVDRDILEKLEAPLNHILRNSIDHGIESPEDRLQAGKNRTGKIKISAFHNAGMLAIHVEDDGRGINQASLKKKIVDRQLSTKRMLESMSEQELFEFLYLPGFSTKSDVSEISGRGVGLDVVMNTIQEIRGKIRTSSQAGQGIRFQLELPLTLSLLRCLLVEISGELYGFPLARIESIQVAHRSDIKTIENRQYLEHENERIGIVDCANILELPHPENVSEDYHVVIIGDHFNKYGLVVDSFQGEYILAIRPVNRILGKIQDINSMAVTRNGETVLILDVDDLTRSIEAKVSESSITTIDRNRNKQSGRPSKRVLVVDDSLTVREVEKKLLLSKGYEVDVAVDGMDGWNTVRSGEYDLVISDVDMPRMNGIELVSLIKQDNHLKDTPVMIVSYKDREEDRMKGLDAGADYYLAKGSFHDESLVEAVVDLIGESEQ